jgi:hypothetical protein
MQRLHRQAHARIWLILAFILPLILVVAVLLRGEPSSAPLAVQFSPAVSGAVK